MVTTTIRVPAELRDRLAREAKQRSTTLAVVIEEALNSREDAQFWGEVRRTMTSPDQRARLRADIVETDSAVRDGLEPESWDGVT